MPAKPYQRVMVPTDFSADSLRALREALGVATRCKAELLIVHVLESAAHPTHSALKSTVHGQVDARLREEIDRELATLSARAVAADIHPRTIVAEGIPADAIVRLAQEEGVDLIVISTHGRSGLSRLLLGSTAEKVVRQAPCSVLVVRGERHQGLG